MLIRFDLIALVCECDPFHVLTVAFLLTVLPERRTVQGAALNVTPSPANDPGLQCVRTGQRQRHQPPDQTGPPQVFEKPRQLPHAVADRPGYENVCSLPLCPATK